MKPSAVGLKVAAARLGMSYRDARRKVAEGRFPIPELPRQGRNWHKYSEVEIDRYLGSASTADARVGA